MPVTASKTAKGGPQPVASPPLVALADIPRDPVPSVKWPLYLAGAMVTVWIAILALLAATTANPPVVNQLQILKSDAVVTVVVDTHEYGFGYAFSIAKLWKGEQIDHLAPPFDVRRWPVGSRVIVPLQKTSNGWRVTQGEASWADFPWAQVDPRFERLSTQLKPLVYPDTPDVQRQLEAALKLPTSEVQP